MNRCILTYLIYKLNDNKVAIVQQAYQAQKNSILDDYSKTQVNWISNASSQTQPNNCLFCKKLKKHKTTSFLPLLQKALYAKYSSSQNYYYSKDITDILENESTQAVVHFRDMETYVDDEEYLKRYYLPGMIRLYVQKELPNKLSSLLEYYKYHIDIPRLYMKSICKTIYYFHDKKRRLEYARIKWQLGLKDDEVQQNIYFQEEDKKNQQDVSLSVLRNVLQPLNSLLKNKNKRNTQDPSFSIQSILQNIPKMDKVQFYMDSFDESAIDRQLHELSKLFTRPLPPQRSPPIIKTISIKALGPKTIPTQVIQSLIQQQKRNSQTKPQPSFKPIDINLISQKNHRPSNINMKSALTSRKNSQVMSQVNTDRNSEHKVLEENKIFLTRPKKRTISSHQPFKKSSSIHQSSTTQLLSQKMNGSQTSRDSRQLEIQHLKNLNFQNFISTTREPLIQQRTNRTKSIDIRNTPAEGNVYVKGCHKKVPSLYTLNQHQMVNIFMQELQSTLKSGPPALQPSNSQRSILSNQTTRSKMKKSFKK